MYCRKCGSPVADDSTFCTVCGTEIQDSVPGANPPVTTGPAVQRKGALRYIGIIVFAAAFLVFLLTGAISAPPFATAANFQRLFIQFTCLGTTVLGMIVTARAGGIDFSIPFQMLLAGTLVASISASTGSFTTGLTVALVVCIAIGFLNGLVINYLRFPAIFMTVITSVVCYMLGRTLAGPGPILLEDHTPWEQYIYVLIFIAAAVCAFLLVYLTGLGKPIAKRTATHKKDKPLYMFSYVAASVFAFLGGLIFLNRLGAAIPSNGLYFEIDCLFPFFFAGCCIWFDNKTAPVPAVLFGCFWMSVFGNLTAILGLSTFYMDIFRFLFLVAAIVLDRVYLKQLFLFAKQKSITESPA